MKDLKTYEERLRKAQMALAEQHLVPVSLLMKDALHEITKKRG